MNNIKRELVIIGGGPAGLSAAVAAYDKGIRDILIIERDDRLGGILNQCIHNGFGLTYFREELTGPEYAHRFVEMVKERNIVQCLIDFDIPLKLSHTVVGIHGKERVEGVTIAQVDEQLRQLRKPMNMYLVILCCYQ